ncbi:MAG: radical SAM protein [Clostridia bacterium]|nr:radical SAM protein [Clostridia bacterium]
MANTITYELDGKLYINMTNRCSNSCNFCVRNGKDEFRGYYLWLDKEPTVNEVIAALGDVATYKEAVFCGFGEPLYRYNDVISVAKYLKEKGIKTRINTNGQALLITGENIVDRIAPYIDTINISLNEVTAEEYNKLCHPVFGEVAYYSLLDFARCCVGKIKRVILSIVDVIGEDKIEKAQKIAQDIGAELRVRKYE